MFGRTRSSQGYDADAASREYEAKKQARRARAEADKAASYRRRLDSGESADPAGDRAKARYHETSQQIHEANARDLSG